MNYVILGMSYFFLSPLTATSKAQTLIWMITGGEKGI
jgi:hypothetical protein